MARLIALTKGQQTIVDDEDFERFGGLAWQAIEYRSRSGRVMGYRASRTVACKSVYLHRVILDAKPDEIVDHVNRDALDNRRVNLRLCSASQNNANRKSALGATGFLGVYRRGKRFIAQISVNHQNLYLGTFASAEEAALARDAAVILHFGDFAVLNFSEAR